MITEEQVLRKQLSQEDQKIENDPNAIYADSLREEKTANLLDQLNPDNLLVDIEHRIRGEKKDPYTQRWVPISEKYSRAINEELISNFVSFLGSILNQNTSMSNFTQHEINNMMTMIITYVKNDLTVNDEKYEIVGNWTEMDRIANIICITCFSTFKQAMNGTFSRRVFGTMKVSADLTKENKKSWKDAVQFWR